MPTLIVGPNWVGDMVLAHGLLAYLKSRRPDDSIHMLAPKWSLDVACRIPEVDKLIESPFAHGELKLKERWKFARRLRSANYHRAFVLPNSFKSALIPAMAGIPRRIGWRGEYRYKLLTDLRILHENRFPRMIDRYMALGFPANLALAANQLPISPGYPKLEVDFEAQSELAKKFGLNANRLVAICPGAEFSSEKKWPSEKFVSLISNLLEKGYQIALLGSPNDKLYSDSIIVKFPQTSVNNLIYLVGKTSIPEVIDILSMAKAVVTNDSGLMHVAAATRRPTVALFGPSSSSHTPPLSNTASIVESSTNQMQDISVDEVLCALSKQMV